MNFSKIRKKKKRLSIDVSCWKLFQIALFSDKKATICLPRKLKKKLWKNLNKGQKNIEEIKKPQSWSSSYNLYYVIYFNQYFKTHSSKTHKTTYFWKPYWIFKKIEKILFVEISICWHQQFSKWMNFSKIPKEKRLSINVSYSKLFQIALFSPKKAAICLLIKLKKKKTVKKS